MDNVNRPGDQIILVHVPEYGSLITTCTYLLMTFQDLIVGENCEVLCMLITSTCIDLDLDTIAMSSESFLIHQNCTVFHTLTE